MDKENYLRESFKNKFVEKSEYIRRELNVLINLTAGDNISIVDDSLKFYDNKIELNIKKVNSDDEIIDGKIVLYDSRRYYYLENNELAKTYLGFIYNNNQCELKYKSIYNDFNIERDMIFKLHKDNNILRVTNELYSFPLTSCYYNLKDKMNSKSTSKNIGLLIADDMYKLIDFDIKLKQVLVEDEYFKQKYVKKLK